MGGAIAGGSATGERVEADGGALGEVLCDLDHRDTGFRFRIIIDEQDRMRHSIPPWVGGKREENWSAAIPPGQSCSSWERVSDG